MSIDWELYCALYRATDSPLWEAVSHPDVQSIADRVGITRITLWRRLREWRRIGFLRGYEFLPNPRLLGAGLELVTVRHATAAARAAFLDELELIDGAFYAEQSFGDDTRVLWMTTGPAGAARRRTLVARIGGVEQISEPTPVWLPTPERAINRSDWRLIAALRHAPTSPFAVLAKELGISPRTCSRRFRSVRARHLMLTYSLEDFGKFPGTVALVSVAIAPGQRSRPIAARIRAKHRGILELAGVDQAPFTEAEQLRYMVEVANVSRVGELEAELGRIAGVASTQSRFLGSSRVYRAWFDDQVHQALQAS